jgi:hypothetical protein
MGQLIDLKNQQFGWLKVVSRAEAPDVQARLSYWTCACKCGREMVVRSDDLRGGSVRSCKSCSTEWKLRAVFSTFGRGERDSTRFSKVKRLEEK